MSEQLELDAILTSFLSVGTDALADRVVDSALDEIERAERRRVAFRPWRPGLMKPAPRLATAAVVAVLAVWGALLLTRPGQSSVAQPSVSPGVTSRPSDGYGPSTRPSASPIAVRQSTWTDAGRMTTPRYLQTATVLPNGVVLVAGGRRSGDGGHVGPALASAELYDPATRTSTQTGSMKTPRELHTATLLPSGKVLVVGGYNDFAALASAELYDPASGTWTAAASMSEGHGGQTATLLPDGAVLVAGGRSNNSSTGGPLITAQLYDAAAGTWTAAPNMLHAHMYAAATLLPDGRVLITGASFEAYHLDTATGAEIYDPGKRAWSATGPMIVAGAYQSATLLTDGTVIVAGGMTVRPIGCCSAGLGDVNAGAQVYEPASERWTPAGAMDRGRVGHTATLLTDGLVLVAGGGAPTEALGEGNGQSSPWVGLASAALYDPASGSWTTTAAMADPRLWHASALLQDGRVLAFGGVSTGDVLDSIEVYDPGTEAH